jgi:hypothetical protein
LGGHGCRNVGQVPIPGGTPTGFDAKYEQEYVDISAEIGKLDAAAPTWHERACAGLQKYGDAPALPADMVAA